MLLLFALITILILESSSSIQQRIRVMVLGGSGRVGGSAVRSLCERYGDNIDIFVGGRDKDNWHKTQERLLINANNANCNKALEKVEFVQMDLTDHLLMEEYLPQYDLTIHTAGPFQGLDKNIVLETCLKHGKKYLDVCDDISLSRITRSSYYQDLAKRNGASAIISTGIWPGGSSLLAQEAIEVVGGK
jgi:saccharopine dehydrogenase-like NADP-dependent oxidoreductase